MASPCSVPADRTPRYTAIESFLASRTPMYAVVGWPGATRIRYMDAGGKMTVWAKRDAPPPEGAWLFSTRQDAHEATKLLTQVEVVTVYLPPGHPRLVNPPALPGPVIAKPQSYALSAEEMYARRSPAYDRRRTVTNRHVDR